MAKSGSKGYSKSQTGTPSKLGGKKTKTQKPWGSNVPSGAAKSTNGVGGGNTNARSRTGATGRNAPTPDPQLWGMDYKPNDPAAWPIEGGKRQTPQTAAKVTRNNLVVENAYTRAKYQ